MERCFKQLKEQLVQEEYLDSQKRKQFGNAWSAVPSTEINKEYLSHVEGKFGENVEL